MQSSRCSSAKTELMQGRRPLAHAAEGGGRCLTAAPGGSPSKPGAKGFLLQLDIASATPGEVPEAAGEAQQLHHPHQEASR